MTYAAARHRSADRTLVEGRRRSHGTTVDPVTGPLDRPDVIRPYDPRDRRALDEVCLRTAASGGDASGQYADPRLLGEVWVGPYVTFEPGLALVLDDGDGAQGYVLGALDTRDFEARCEQEWWPPLRVRHPLPGSPAAAGAVTADARVVELVHRPPRAPDAVVAGHPSHLHIDLLPRWQGGGWGRRLLEQLLGLLADGGSPGVHLGVGADNVRARGFYAHLGFREIEVVGDTRFLGRSTR
jgi:ribosomal protein S18 acetylase RimI-like enzyme